MDDPARITAILFDAVTAVLEEFGEEGIPVKALLTFEYLGGDGREQVNFVVTESMGRTETIGHARLIETQVLADLMEDDGE